MILEFRIWFLISHGKECQEILLTQWTIVTQKKHTRDDEMQNTHILYLFHIYFVITLDFIQ